jgi:hypothetical protein
MYQSFSLNLTCINSSSYYFEGREREQGSGEEVTVRNLGAEPEGG